METLISRKRWPYPDWHSQAACIDADEKTYFGSRDTSERPAVTLNDIKRAKAICATCPVFKDCLETALGVVGGNREEYGVWAGTSGRTRKRIWEMVAKGETTLSQAVIDICAGDGAKYETTMLLKPVVQALKVGVVANVG